MQTNNLLDHTGPLVICCLAIVFALMFFQIVVTGHDYVLLFLGGIVAWTYLGIKTLDWWALRQEVKAFRQELNHVS